MSAAIRDQLVLITGSSRGLGLAIAKAFHNEGAKVIINYRNPASKSAVEGIAKDIDATAIPADVSDPNAVKQLFASAEQIHGQPISVIVNNALSDYKFNGDARSWIHNITWAEYEKQLNVTLHGSLNTLQAALPGFEKLGRGRIINIGTDLVVYPGVPYHDYIAAKGALLAFTKTTAAELGPKGIAVNMVSGGLLERTDASSHTPQEGFDLIKSMVPMRKITKPEDVAGSVVFFAGPSSSMVTGQHLLVNGGLYMP